MPKRIISIVLLLFMAIAIAAPLLPHRDCDMPCCEVVVPTCCEKEMDMPKKSCSMDMKSCDMGGTFVPLPTAPLHQFKLKTHIDFTRFVENADGTHYYKINFNPVLLDHPPEPPPAYNLPLLA